MSGGWGARLGRLLPGAAIAALADLRRRPFLGWGWLWFLVALLPVGGFFQAGVLALADRFTYVPHVGLAVALSWSAADLAAAGRGRRLLAAGGCAAVVALLAVVTARQLPFWRDSSTLFARAVAVTRGNAVAYNNLAAALAGAGETAEAARLLREALGFAPDNPLLRNNLGVNLMRGGDLAAAEEEFRRARDLDPRREITLLNLGMALAAQGEGAEAVRLLDQAVNEQPGSAAAHATLGAVLLRAGAAAAARARALELERRR